LVGEDLYVYILSFGRYGRRFRGGGEMGGENWKKSDIMEKISNKFKFRLKFKIFII